MCTEITASMSVDLWAAILSLSSMLQKMETYHKLINQIEDSVVVVANAVCLQVRNWRGV